MKIRLTTCLATADETFNNGQIIDRDDAEARRLIAAGFATPAPGTNPKDAALETPERDEELETADADVDVEQLAPEVAPGVADETADEAPAPAPAPAPKPRRKRRSKKQ